MPLAVITFTDGSVKQTGDQDIAIKAYKAKHGQLELTPKQQAYTDRIKSVLLPNSWRPADYQPVIKQAVDVCMSRPAGLSTLRDVNTRAKNENGFKDSYEAKMTNIGVLQGMSEIIPRGDR